MFALRASPFFEERREVLGQECPSVIDKPFVIRYNDRWRWSMETVTISPKFQVVIPKSIRDRLDLRPGQKVQAILYENRIELVPVRPVREMKGFLKGIDTDVPREEDRV
jgi:AbrB family looped-hinge helix DNA binding protein